MTDPPRDLVFVYGTLRSGGSNHFRLERAQSLGPASVRGRLYAIDWYPGLVLDPSAGPVRGELFAVDAALLRELDAFEGIPPGTLSGQEYRRVRTPVDTPSGETRSAWLWEWLGPVDQRRLLDGGDWLANGD